MNAAEVVIDKFGGQTALAELIGKRQSNISYWAKTGIIPAKWRPQILRIANEKGIELEARDFDLIPEPRMNLSYPQKSTHEGKLVLGENGVELNCAVLSDGTRIISRNAIFKAFGRTKRGRALNETTRERTMPSFIDAKNLQPFISDELREILNRIDYTEINGKQGSGYNALILPQLCKVYHDARAADALKPSQEPLARVSEVLLFSLSKIGIIALVDEATGYQYDRERDELQTVLKQYIAEELLPWQKKFPDEFYKEIFRLRGWPFTVKGIKQRPGVIGTWTKNLIYRQLPKGVLQELYRITPKTSSGKLSKRLHQGLSIEVGNPHLEKQLVSVITLMNISESWAQFEAHFNKKFGQQKLDFESEEMIERNKNQ